MPVLVTLDNAIDLIGIEVASLPLVRANHIAHFNARCGSVFVDTEDRCIIVMDNYLRSLRYYGGFEYINDEFVTSIGPYTIYAAEDNDGNLCKRVVDALEYFKDLYPGA